MKSQKICPFAFRYKRDKKDRGFFGTDSQIRRINREWIVILAAQRALLLQIAHPAVAAGVAQHSDWLYKPYRRFLRTVWLFSKIVFGSKKIALAAAKSINCRHQSVKGQFVIDDSQKPVCYHASDPVLSSWVLATLLDSTLLAYERWVRPLQAEEREQYLQDFKKLAEFFGISENYLPADYNAFAEYMKNMIEGDTLIVTSESKEMVEVILSTPRILAPLIYKFTVDLLPEAIRRKFGLAWDGNRQCLQERLNRRIRNLYRNIPALLRVNFASHLARTIL